MATYIKIAPQETNLSGIASKGYMINRKGTTVFIKWGAIKSINRKFYWAGKKLPMTKKIIFENIEETISFTKNKIRKITKQEYKKLQRGKQILK